ncbi:WAT1-related protein At2g39510-like [Mangifera indica]|uniref:WAT1-related protein At2g39510-like n=1 Tax=Mangifera indica TaxID=29780 RepID=UPI001CFB9E25|nr:WAT1-related protein At2g39510-like [Mangifera indica]
MKYTAATFTVAMSNLLPAMAFIMAWIFRKLHSQAKIVGNLVAVGGGIIMAFVKGTLLDLPWTNGRSIIFKKSATDVEHTDLMKGAVIIIAHILRSYPSVLGLAALVCMLSSVESIILAFPVERGNTKIWSIFNPDAKLLAVIYGGIMSCSTYIIMGWVIKKNGPVFATYNRATKDEDVLSLIMQLMSNKEAVDCVRDLDEAQEKSEKSIEEALSRRSHV